MLLREKLPHEEEVTILNRKIMWRTGKTDHEAADDHAQIMCEPLGPEDGSNKISNPDLDRVQQWKYVDLWLIPRRTAWRS